MNSPCTDFEKEPSDFLLKVLRGCEVGIADCEENLDEDSDRDRRAFWTRRDSIVAILKARSREAPELLEQMNKVRNGTQRIQM
jgi:hypothetical protein